jgi:hypothetical protein
MDINFIFYNKLLDNPIIDNALKIKSMIEVKENKSKCEALCYEVCRELIKFADEHQMEGNLWAKYIIWSAIQDENLFTLDVERNNVYNKSNPICELVIKDIEKIIQLIEMNWGDINENTEWMVKSVLDYKRTEKRNYHPYYSKLESLFNYILDRPNVEMVLDALINFYAFFGIGSYGRYSAFRWENSTVTPIKFIDSHRLKDLVGIELQTSKLVKNTEAFIKGLPGNNVLLYGDSGTGKSSSIKGLLNDYYDQGLRMVEVYKYQFKELPKIIDCIRKRPYKWILFFDDLSFEEYEIEYKYLKAIFEGSLEKKPDNVLIYATSNRRHLIRESWKDRPEYGDELHINDNLQEKLSLADRFGLSIAYLTPNQAGYLKIVETLAEKERLDLPLEVLHKQAMTWEIQHASYSGRVAEQFIQHIKTNQ